MKIDLVSGESIQPPRWRTTHILLPDARILEASLRELGWLVPLVVRADGGDIIDGSARWTIASGMPRLFREIPIVVHDCDEADAMVLHVRLNRGRGAVVNRDLSRLIRLVMKSDKYDQNELCKLLNMSYDEFQVLADGSLIKARKIKQHRYSTAWVPIEASRDESVATERPPNEDG